jgi:hypothetical protein
MGGTSGESYGKGAGDYPIRKKSLLPTAPSQRGLYDIIKSFMGTVQNAYELGVSPPESATPEDILKWKAQVSPWAEQQILNTTNLKGKRPPTEQI